MMREDKPMLSTEEQINHLVSKGVKFDIVSIEEATAYLKKSNNYFKLRAYRKNFPKHPDGEKKGSYINLDFALLKDLSIIDMRLRYTLIQLALDIEHFAKVKLLLAVEDSNDDGYQIVDDYQEALKMDDLRKETNYAQGLMNELSRNKNNPYCGGIIGKYSKGYPVWAFVEIVPLGTFNHFYLFCGNKLDRKDLINDFYLLTDIRQLRNAAAHSNCILHDMGAKDCKYSPNYRVVNALSEISKSTRDNQLMNERMRQIITLLYAHTSFITSPGVLKHTRDMLDDLICRMYRNIVYYESNENIMSSFEFLKKSIDILYH